MGGRVEDVSSRLRLPLPGIGVFGTGPATDVIVPHLRQAGFRIEAVWGKTYEEAQGCAGRLGIPFATQSIDDVLLRKDVDLILVLSPPSLHAQITVKALGIGKHVAVEPPAGINQSETLRKVKAALYYPSLLSIVVYGLRFLPAFARLKKALVEEDMIGALSLVDVQIDAPSLIRDDEAYSWACEHGMGGGVLNQFGSHVIDVLQYLGFRATRVHGAVRTLKRTTAKIRGIRQIQAEDFATFQMEGAISQPSSLDVTGQDDVLVTVNITGASSIKEFGQRLTFHGSKGHSLVVTGEALELRTREGATVTLTSADEDGTPKPPEHDRSIPAVYQQGIGNLLHQLADRLVTASTAASEGSEGGTAVNEDIAGFDEALYVHAVIEAVRWSSKNKAWAKVSLAQW